MQKLAADAAIEDQTTKEWAAGEAARKATAAAKKARKAVSKRSAAKKVGANRALPLSARIAGDGSSEELARPQL